MKTSLIALVLAFSSFSLVAQAQPVYGPQAWQLDVPYADLNLSNPVGAQAMLSRIKHAASHVCGGVPDMLDLRSWSQYRTCVHAAMDDAVSQLHAPLVTAMYTGRPSSDTRLAYGRRQR